MIPVDYPLVNSSEITRKAINMASGLNREDQARCILHTARNTWHWDPAIENGKPVINPGSDIEITVELVAALAHATGVNGRNIPCRHDAIRDAVLVLRGQAQFVGSAA
jgi:hypothetical protein